MSITPSANLRMQFNRSGRTPWENNMRNYFSTRVPASGFIQALGRSEHGKMTGHEANVGFVATGSGVKQFQLSPWGSFALQCRRFSAQLTLTKHTRNSRASAAVLHETGNFDPQDTVRGTPTSGVPENVPVRAYQCLDWGVSRTRLFFWAKPDRKS